MLICLKEAKKQGTKRKTLTVIQLDTAVHLLIDVLHPNLTDANDEREAALSDE